MALYQQIEEQLKDAMRAQDKERLSALRNMKAFLKNKSIDLMRELKDEEVIQFLATLAKQRRESIEAFTAGGRMDLVDKEQFELKVIEAFLPAPLSPEAIDEIIRQAIQSAEAKTPQDLGKVMKLVQPQVAGRADGKRLTERIRELLS